MRNYPSCASSIRSSRRWSVSDTDVHARDFAEIQCTPPTDPKASDYEVITAMNIDSTAVATAERLIDQAISEVGAGKAYANSHPESIMIMTTITTSRS
jgi:hypothetical protein